MDKPCKRPGDNSNNREVLRTAIKGNSIGLREGAPGVTEEDSSILTQLDSQKFVPALSLSQVCLTQVPRIIWMNIPCFKWPPDDPVNIYFCDQRMSRLLWSKSPTHILISPSSERNPHSPHCSFCGSSSFNSDGISALCQSQQNSLQSLRGLTSFLSCMPCSTRPSGYAHSVLAPGHHFHNTVHTSCFKASLFRLYLCLSQLPVTLTNT